MSRLNKPEWEVYAESVWGSPVWDAMVWTVNSKIPYLVYKLTVFVRCEETYFNKCGIVSRISYVYI